MMVLWSLSTLSTRLTNTARHSAWAVRFVAAMKGSNVCCITGRLPCNSSATAMACTLRNVWPFTDNVYVLAWLTASRDAASRVGDP